MKGKEMSNAISPHTSNQKYGDIIIQNGIRGYLVLASCSMDDFPVALVDSLELAVAIADGMVPDVPEHIQDIFGIDASELVCFKVLLFVDGKPKRIIHTRTVRLEDE